MKGPYGVDEKYRAIVPLNIWQHHFIVPLEVEEMRSRQKSLLLGGHAVSELFLAY